MCVRVIDRSKKAALVLPMNGLSYYQSKGSCHFENRSFKCLKISDFSLTFFDKTEHKERIMENFTLSKTKSDI